jgi:ADP-heptose:LPS heptosyltransferase
MSLKAKLWIDYYLGGLLQFLFKPLAILLGKLLSRDHDLKKCSEVTYLKLLGGGSLVIAYPSLLGMRRNPNIKKLRIVCTAKTAPFARALGVFDEILTLSDSSAAELMVDSLGVLRKLSRTEAIIDLEIHSRLSTIFCLFTRARNRIGVYTDSSFWRRSLATHLLFYNRRSSMFGLYDQISHLFGSEIPDFSDCVATFRAGIGESAANVGEGYHIAVMPCCSDLSRERKLRDEDWPRVLGERLSALRGTSRVTIHFLGGPGDEIEIAPLMERLGVLFPAAHFENHAGKLKLNESVALLGKMHEAICIDSALMHFARLMGTPTTTYWGPTDPHVYLRPHASVAERVHSAAISCSPCVHIANTAPCRGNNLCMKLAADPNCGVDPNPVWLAQNPGRKDHA